MGDVNTETAPVAKNQIFGDAEIQYQKAKSEQHKAAVEAREGSRNSSIRLASARSMAGSVAVRVLPSPVCSSATPPSNIAMPPMICTV